LDNGLWKSFLFLGLFGCVKEHLEGEDEMLAFEYIFSVYVGTVDNLFKCFKHGIIVL
jgi:hypothetical protein